MSKKLSPEVNAALIQAAATIACREHQVMVEDFIEKETTTKFVSRFSVICTPAYEELTSRKLIFKLFSTALDELKANAQAGMFELE
ncbi:hypothetical protein [Acetobacter sp. LMG 32666]|uniref:hypothetical protein n=1 Tax=Acetobacter sp. LMG 32666 TaxID=2959295 RepID=UPI0030C7CFDD